MTTWQPEPPSHCSGDACPSNLVLDQLQLGELNAADAAALQKKIAECAGCQERLATVEAGLSAFSELDAAAMVARIHTETAQIEFEHSESLWHRIARLLRSPRGLGTSFAVLAATIIMITQPPKVSVDDPYGGAPETIRLKGGESWLVYRERDGQIETLAQDATVQPNDRLRFELRGFTDGHIAVFGAEASGKLYPIYPLVLGNSAPHRGSRQGPLPGAIALDSSLGQEWLYLVHCPQSFSMSEVRIDGRATSAPANCEVLSLALNKVTE